MTYVYSHAMRMPSGILNSYCYVKEVSLEGYILFSSYMTYIQKRQHFIVSRIMSDCWRRKERQTDGAPGEVLSEDAVQYYVCHNAYQNS